jgi:hypothetical protein
METLEVSMPKSGLTPEERSMRARHASLVGWAKTSDVQARTRPGRDAAFERFEREVDPTGSLPLEERARRARYMQQAHMVSLAYRSAVARRKRSEAKKGGGDG